MHTFFRSPLVRQPTGAVVGAMVALMVYTIGSWTVDHVQAMLMNRAEARTAVTKETRDAKMDRIAADAKVKAQKYVKVKKD